MNIIEAINYYQDQNIEAQIYCDECKHCDEETKEMFKRNDLVIQALKKQMSNKISIFDYGKAHCPNCKSDIHGIGKIEYCFKCGQKLEWF